MPEEQSKRPISFRDLLELKVVSSPQISPDGKSVVFSVRSVDKEKNRYLSHLWRADVQSGEVSQFTYGDISDSSPRWSPDGSHIAFIRTRDKKSQIWTMPSGGGEAHPLTKLADGGPGAPAWSPDGNRLAFTFKATHTDRTEEAAKKREEMGLSTPPRVVNRLFYRLDGEGFLDERQHIWVCDANSGEAKQLTHDDYEYGSPVWSPDGNRLAFAANRSADPDLIQHEVDIWLMPSDGGELERLATPVGYKGNLSWSPDGSHIAYLGAEVKDDPWKPYNTRLWVVPLSGGEAKCLTSSLDRPVENMTISDTGVGFESGQSPVWSKDGESLYFLASDSGACHIYRASTAGGQFIQLTQGKVEAGGFTVDGNGENLTMLMGGASKPSEIYTAKLNAESPDNLSLECLTHMNGEFFGDVTASEPEEFWIDCADGHRLQVWLMKPLDFDSGKSYPLLFYIHGGPHLQYGYSFMHEFQAHASRGYVVLYTNPRGSMGYGEEFGACIRGDWGNLDYQDLMATVDFAQQLPYVDSQRMAVAGGSYGGFMTNWIISHDDRFKCAISDRGLSNMHADFGTTDWPDPVDGYWSGNGWNQTEKLWQQSPLQYVESINTPVLIIHSEGDLRCPIHHAEQFYVALKYLKREVEFVRYPPETSHGLSRNGPPDLRIDRLNRIAEWLDSHLKT